MPPCVPWVPPPGRRAAAGCVVPWAGSPLCVAAFYRGNVSGRYIAAQTCVVSTAFHGAPYPRPRRWSARWAAVARLPDARALAAVTVHRSPDAPVIDLE